MPDIQTLNQRACQAELEVTAVSIHAYAYIWRRIRPVGSGSSMGDGYGPRLVSTRPDPSDPRAALRGRRVAVPGLLTTAYLALQLFQPDFDGVVMPFDRIEEAVHAERWTWSPIDQGQLTYADAGLHLWADLGAWWLRNRPSPTAGRNAVRRDLGTR